MTNIGQHLHHGKDARAGVVKVLAAVDVYGELEGLVMCGARYGFPGWVSQQTTWGAKTKRVYLERPQAAAKAREYFAGGESPGQIAGRWALIAMAVLADEQCVARSNRAGHDLHRYRPCTPTSTARLRALSGPRSVAELVEEICVEQLPVAATERLRERREHEKPACEQDEAKTHAAQATSTQLAERMGS